MRRRKGSEGVSFGKNEHGVLCDERKEDKKRVKKQLSLEVDGQAVKDISSPVMAFNGAILLHIFRVGC